MGAGHLDGLCLQCYYYVGTSKAAATTREDTPSALQFALQQVKQLGEAANDTEEEGVMLKVSIRVRAGVGFCLAEGKPPVRALD